MTMNSTSHESPEEIHCRFGGTSALRHILEDSSGCTEGPARGSREYVPNEAKVPFTN